MCLRDIKDKTTLLNEQKSKYSHIFKLPKSIQYLLLKLSIRLLKQNELKLQAAVATPVS